MRYHAFLSFIIILCTSCLTYGQVTATDGTDIRIFPTSSEQSEIHISINKTNPLNLLVSANTWAVGALEPNQGYYYSQDGGITWLGADHMPDSRPSFGDPATCFDASGKGYVAGMFPTDDYWYTHGYFIEKTTDRGDTWSGSVTGHTDLRFDKEMIIAVDEMQTSSYVNYFYCAWTDFNYNSSDYLTVKINRSTDGGSTFSDMQILSTPSNGSYGQGTNLQTGPNGEVYVCWAHYPHSNTNANSIGFARSTNGGSSFTTSYPINYIGIRTSDPNSLFGNTSVNDFPTMAVDKSCSSTRGRIYITYPEFESSSSTKSVIRIRHSDNGGVTWSDATTISIASASQSFLPWISVDDLTGLVTVAYMAFYQSTGTLTNTYVAYYSEGGNWQNVLVSDAPHYTAPIDNSKHRQGYFGDYIGIATYGGISYVAWMDNRSSNWQAYVSRVDFNIQPILSSQSSLSINESIINHNRRYQAYSNVQAANNGTVTIQGSTAVEIVAGNSITLWPGFTCKEGSEVIAQIASVDACTTPGAVALIQSSNYFASDTSITRVECDGVRAFSYPNPTSEFITVGAIGELGDIYARIVDLLGKEVVGRTQLVGYGDHSRKMMDISTLKAGTYYVLFDNSHTICNVKIVKY